MYVCTYTHIRKVHEHTYVGTYVLHACGVHVTSIVHNNRFKAKCSGLVRLEDQKLPYLHECHLLLLKKVISVQSIASTNSIILQYQQISNIISQHPNERTFISRERYDGFSTLVLWNLVG